MSAASTPSAWNGNLSGEGHHQRPWRRSSGQWSLGVGHIDRNDATVSK